MTTNNLRIDIVTSNSDQIPRETVAQVEHEDDVGHLRQGPAPTQRRLGLRKR